MLPTAAITIMTTETKNKKRQSKEPQNFYFLIIYFGCYSTALTTQCVRWRANLQDGILDRRGESQCILCILTWFRFEETTRNSLDRSRSKRNSHSHRRHPRSAWLLLLIWFVIVAPAGRHHCFESFYFGRLVVRWVRPVVRLPVCRVIYLFVVVSDIVWWVVVLNLM